MKFLLGWLATGVVLLAADVSGAWSGSLAGRDGQSRNLSFQLKQSGERLEGTLTGPTGRSVELSDGQVKGDEVRFKVSIAIGERSFVQSYAGRVSGDEMQLKVMRDGRDRATELILRRSK